MYAMGFIGFAGLVMKMIPQIRNFTWVSDLWLRKIGHVKLGQA
jgi:hypothetical protein